MILLSDINLAGLTGKLGGCRFEIGLEVQGVGAPRFGAAIFGLDKDRKYIADDCKENLFWNVALQQQATALQEQIDLDSLLKERYLDKVRYLRIIFYNIRGRDNPDSQILIKNITGRALKYESEKMDFELIRNGSFASGSDHWGLSGAIVAENGRIFFKAGKNQYIILKQKITSDNLPRILRSRQTWRVKVSARGENRPRIGMIIANSDMVPLQPKNIFWDIPLDDQTTQIERVIDLNFLEKDKDCTGLVIFVYRSDFKKNPSGQVYIENLSMTPVIPEN